MKVGYTQFSYGYAFTENLIRCSSKAPTGRLYSEIVFFEADANGGLNRQAAPRTVARLDHAECNATNGSPK